MSNKHQVSSDWVASWAADLAMLTNPQADGDNAALADAVRLKDWPSVGQLLRNELPGSQRTRTIMAACRRAGEDDVLEHIIPNVQTEQELKAAINVIVPYRRKTVGGALIQRGLDMPDLLQGVSEILNHSSWEDTFGFRDILCTCPEDKLKALSEECVQRRHWRTVSLFLRHGMGEEYQRWVVEQAAANADDSPAWDVLSQCFDDRANPFNPTTPSTPPSGACSEASSVEPANSTPPSTQLSGDGSESWVKPAWFDSVFEKLVKRHLWNTIEHLLYKFQVDDVLVRQAIEESYRSFAGKPLTGYTLPTSYDDKRSDFELMCTVSELHSERTARLLRRGQTNTCNSTLHRWAVTQISKLASQTQIVTYILPCFTGGRVSSNQTHCKQALRGFGSSKLSDSHTMMQTRSTTSAGEDVPKHAENADKSDVARSGQCYLTDDHIHFLLHMRLGSELHDVSRPCVEEKKSTEAAVHTQTVVPEESLQANIKTKQELEIRHIFSTVAEWSSDQALFILLTSAGERGFRTVIHEIREEIDGSRMLSEILCEAVASLLPKSVEDLILFINHISMDEDPLVRSTLLVFTEILHFTFCRSVCRSAQSLNQSICLWGQTLVEIHQNCKFDIAKEKVLLYVFFCLCCGVARSEESNNMLAVIMTTVPLLPSLQSAAVQLVLRDRRWDVLDPFRPTRPSTRMSGGHCGAKSRSDAYGTKTKNLAIFWRVWEDVRRAVLREAVEQRQWTVVKHMADHSLYDDQRNWALMEAFYEKQWDVVLALADFGHDHNQRKRIYRQVAKHADWRTVLKLFTRGADVCTVREELETAIPSRERPPRSEVVDRYKHRLSKLDWLEWRTECKAEDLELAIEHNSWRAVLHRVRWDPDTLSSALDAAIQREVWPIVLQLVRLGVDATRRDALFPEVIMRRQWAVARALLEGGYFDNREHGVSVELRRAALPQLLNAGQWVLVARIMEHGVEDAERRRVMWEALDRREGSVVAHIINIMDGRVTVEERERVFRQAFRQPVWQALKRLVEEKDSVGVRHRDLTLPAAARHHQWDVLTNCLQHGADIDKRDAEGDTLLHKAAKEGDWEGVKGLLLHGVANQHLLDSRGYSLLHRAVNHMTGSSGWDVVKMLVEFQCDVNQPDPRGRTPLERMIQFNQGAVIKHTMFWGRDVSQTVTRDERKTALHAVCEAGVLDTMHIIVARGGNPLAVTREGETVLHLAVKNKICPQELLAECIQLGINTFQPQVTNYFMERAAREDPLGDAYYSPLFYVVYFVRSMTVTKMLYESGACSNRELHNLAHKWSAPFSHTHTTGPDECRTVSLDETEPFTCRIASLERPGLSRHAIRQVNETESLKRPGLSGKPVQYVINETEYVSSITGAPRSLQSSCRLVVSHQIGICKPRKRKERIKQLRVQTVRNNRMKRLPLPPHMQQYLLFADLTDPQFGKNRSQKSVSTKIPDWYQWDSD